MGNRISYLNKVVYEKEGWKLGHNDNPDVKKLESDQTWLLLNPSGTLLQSGNYQTLMECLSDDPEDIAWRGRRFNGYHGSASGVDFQHTNSKRQHLGQNNHARHARHGDRRHN